MIYEGFPIPQRIVQVQQGATYNVLPGASETGLLLINGTQTIVMSVGVLLTITAQTTELIFQYPNLIPAGTSYSHIASYEPIVNPGNSYNIVWGANEISLYNNGNIIYPPAVVSVIAAVNYFILTGNASYAAITAGLYATAIGLQFTAQITLLYPAQSSATQQTTIQFYTSVLGKVDYRFGNDFTLVNADTINTTFSSNLNLPFKFPQGSYPQTNPVYQPITQER